jgi:hypothetical protein
LKTDLTQFQGFSKDLFKFLSDLEKNNRVEWFQNNRDKYLSALVEPTKSFISEMAPFLNRLNPIIRTEPKFNETIMRLNKDMRFAKSEPYRAFLLIHFGRFKLDSEFYIYFEPNDWSIGMFINRSEEENLFFHQNQIKFRKEIQAVCRKYKINNNYSLSFLRRDPSLVLKKFDAEKHYDHLYEYDLLLLEKVKKPSEKKLFSTDIIVEMIKMISQLYPLYCFAISPQPLKLLNRFEEEFGEIL